MEIAGGSIRPLEIIAALKALSSYINKDKNAICLALIVINENILQWYKEIVVLIDNEILKNLLTPGEKMTLNDASKLLMYIDKGERKDVMREFVLFLEDIKDRYHHGGLKRLVHILDIDKLNEIRVLCDELAWITDLEVGLFPFREIMKEYGDIDRAETLRKWLKTLETKKDNTRNKISSMLYELECQQQAIDILREKVFKKESK
jgi:hypothetical protein